jgi:hypothetical protein
MPTTTSTIEKLGDNIMEFKTNRLEEFKLGWLVGDFEPALIRSKDLEVAIKHFKKGDTEPSHKQLIATEITIIVSGEIRLGECRYLANEIVTIPPGVYADFEALTDCTLVCIKNPSIPNDKVLK